jgi:hypothetical protein
MSIDDQTKLTYLQSELTKKQQVYPKFIEMGRLTADDANTELQIMQAVVDDYTAKVGTG